MQAVAMSSSVFRYRGWFVGLLVLPALVLWALSAPLIQEGTWIDNTFDCVGWMLLGCGMLLRLWATLYVGGRKGVAMVKDGPYAMCRHPLYLGSFLIVLALMAFLKSITVASACSLAVLLHALLIIPSEEKYLISIFGAAYAAYCRSTPRFLPAFTLLKRPGLQEVKVGAFLLEAVRGLGCIAAALTTELVSHARGESWWPHLLQFN